MIPCLVIPAYRPSPALIELVHELLDDPYPLIVVVDDGSGPDYAAVFAKLKGNTRVRVLEHRTNQGKGAALKTAIEFLLQGNFAHCGLVTVDADGQHLPEDVRRIANEAARHPNSLCLGVRALTKEMPVRSLFGNILTRGIFHLLMGKLILDTQTGLRAVPPELLPELLSLKSRHYDFELEMLVSACQRGLTVIQVPIKTVYLDGNVSSHFNPMLDSLRVYSVFLRFSLSSLVTFVIDTIVFSAAFHFTGYIFLSTLTGRIAAGIFNFNLGRTLVFHSKGPLAREAIRYAVLVFSLMLVSYSLVTLFVKTLGIPVIVAKVFSETVLFLLSFTLQRLFVFSSRWSNTLKSDRKTDWATYYKSPAKTSSITRKITSKKIIDCFRKYADSATNCSIIELGGANSCFFQDIQDHITPSQYTIVDNSEAGLSQFQKTYPQARNHKLICDDILDRSFKVERADICFSVGLIEHFDEPETRLAIKAHFESVKPGGLVLMTFPTPTWLYCASRRTIELLGKWIFHDERPLTMKEVVSEAGKYGELVFKHVNWPIILTQGIIVVRVPELPLNTTEKPLATMSSAKHN